MLQRKMSAVTCAKDEYTMKFAAARVFSSVVNLVSRNVPEEMVVNFTDYKSIQRMTLLEEITLKCCGLVVECRSLPATDNYLCTILAPASIFKPSLVHNNFELDVFTSGGLLQKGQLLDCDFHYNLAVVTIETQIPLQAANFKSIDDDTLSIHPTPDHLHSLRPHSDSFKVLPDTQLVAVSRCFFEPHRLRTYSGTFCSKSPEQEFFGARSPTILTCNELYYIKFESDTYKGLDGVTVVNSLGEIVGILFHPLSFLPSNIISRWWNHYKISGEFRRPVVGMEVGNLYDADLESLAEFITKFPGVSSGVVVSKVDKDSAASRSGIRVNDVIVTLDGKPVQSKLKFYELIWDKAGKSVELDVLRVSNGEKLNLSLVIEDASTEKFHQWSDPHTSRQ